jgi:hypothetical protein
MQNISKIPSRYYQLGLLNVGLIIALYKGMTLLGILSSLVFITLAVAPLAIYLGVLSPPPHEIIQEEISNRLRGCCGKFSEYLSRWQSSEEEQKTKLVVKVPSK